MLSYDCLVVFFFFQAEDGIRVLTVTGVQTCALPIYTSVSMASGTGGHRHAGIGFAEERQLEILADRAPAHDAPDVGGAIRSEERRGGKEGRTRGSPDHLKKKKRKRCGARVCREKREN